MTRLPAAVAPERMAQLVTDLGLVGGCPGGMVRFTYDDAWVGAADLVERWMRDAGLSVRRDAVGNVLGRAEGTDSPRTVLTGSHLDTVLLGGKYDGALGVVAALAAVDLLLTHCGRPSRSLEVVALCEEEGSRYHSNFLGSRAMLGQVERSELDSLRDADGITLAEAMRRVGLDPDAVGSARRDDVDAFVELHIEQGRTLHDEGTQIGVVEAITALDWLEVTVRGQADHAGTTPMHARRDAMQAAAAMTTAVTALVEQAGHPAVVTCGRWEVEPGGPNIVPGRVRFSVDLRHPDEDVLAELARGVADACRRVAGARGVAVTVERAKYAPPAPMDAGLRGRVAEAARVCGATWRDLPSGAGHDSQMWAPHVPTAMIFVPSVDGRSHCPEEYTSPEDAARGATVLATLLHSLAYPAG